MRETRAILPLVAAILLAATACRHQSVQPRPLTVPTVTAQLDTLFHRQSFIATLAPNFEAVIQPRVQGFLTASMFKNGMPVRSGELLFRLDGREQRADRMAAEAALESARVAVIEARNSYERAVPLAEIDAISRAQLDQYTAKYAAARSSLRSAEQRLTNARLSEAYTQIHSPIDGIISTSKAHIGDYVGPGTQFATLTSIRNLDTVSVDLALPMSLYLELSGRRDFTYDNRGLLSHISLYLADGSRYEHEGCYQYTRQNVADAMGTILLVVGFPNPDFALKAGQFARVEANVGRAMTCVTVPQRAVAQLQNISSVWVIRPDSTAEYRRVSLGDMHGTSYVITEGVDVGERVAVAGGQKLRNGQRVVPQIYGGEQDE